MHKKNLRQFDDEHLFRLFCLEGRKDCLGEIYRRYRHLLLGLCLKYLKDPAESKDIVIDIFERLLSSDMKKYSEVEDLKSWLYIITRNYCINEIRKEHYAIGQKIETYKFYYAENVELDPFERHINSELINKRQESLHSSLVKLKADYQTCINMFYFNGKTYKQIADETGLTLKQVKSKLQNGKIALKNMMTDVG